MSINRLKFIGGVLLIVGTSIGGGLLALPVVTAQAGFIDTTLFLILCWMVMTLSALFILEANLWLPPGSNMISMAAKTLGGPGKIVAWLSYLLLLYTLLSGYIAGGTDVFQSILLLLHIDATSQLTTLFYVLTFALIVYMGIRSVDYVNSFLMYAKMGVYLLLLILITPHISLAKLQGGELRYIPSAIMVLITSYGFAIIVPSLREYFNDDVVALRKVILVGSLFPLICYIAWEAAIMGVIPREGHDSLTNLMTSSHSTSGLAKALEDAVHKNAITNLFRFFSSISMLTAFLGVSLCLFDFLADGLNFEKSPGKKKIIASLVFFPPLIIVLCKPGIYIQAFSIAGLLCVILLLGLPALMVLRGRYKLHLQGPYTAPFGKPGIFIVLLTTLLLLGIALKEFIS